MAAAELGIAPADCLVVEDATAGVEAAKAGRMTALGVARLGDEALLRAAGADLVVTGLDEVVAGALTEGRLLPRRVRKATDMQDALTPTADPGWVLEEHGYDPLRETSVEARFAVSNGFLGVRGARAVGRGPMWVSWLHTLSWASWPRTYVAGLFDTPNTEPAVPALVPAADWLRVRILLNGRPLLRRSGDTLAHSRVLDMRRGTLITDWRQRDPAGVIVRVNMLRAVSLAERALGLQLLRLEVEQGQVEVTLEALFEGAGLGLEEARLEQDLGVWRTEQSGKGLAMAGAPALQLGAAELAPRTLEQLKWTWNWASVPGQVASFQRLVAFVRSDDPGADPGPAARAALGKARQIGWRAVLDAHDAAWAHRWRAATSRSRATTRPGRRCGSPSTT